MVLSPCRSVLQHGTITHCRNRNLTTAKFHLPIIFRPGSEVSQSRIHTSEVSKDTFIHTQTRLVHFSPRSNIGARLSIAHFSPDRSIHSSPRDPQILVSRIVTRSSKPWKPSSISLPHDPASICTETLLVYLKFSTPCSRCILLTSSTLRKRLPSTREPSV